MVRLFKKFGLLLASILMVGSFALPATVLAQSDNAKSACEGLALTGSGGCDSTGGGKSVDDTIKLVINVLSFIVGIAAVIMIIIGGFKYVTSQGDSNNINSAKNTILYALIGLVVVALAQVLVRFVLGRVK